MRPKTRQGLRISLAALAISQAFLSHAFGEGFRVGNFEEVTPGVGFQLAVIYETVEGSAGGATLIRPTFRAKEALHRPIDVTVGMTEERYEAWGNSIDSVEIRLEVLVGTRWQRPTQASMDGEPGLLPKGVRHVHIRVNPGAENDSFTFWFRTPGAPERVRLLVLDGGPVYDIKIPWSGS